jgi:hypothetical protein
MKTSSVARGLALGLFNGRGTLAINLRRKYYSNRFSGFGEMMILFRLPRAENVATLLLLPRKPLNNSCPHLFVR